MKKSTLLAGIFSLCLTLNACYLTASPPPLNVDRFYLPPEYEPVQAVMVSRIILDDDSGYQLLRLLLQSQVNPWLLTPSPLEFSAVREHLRERFQLSAETLAHLKSIQVSTESLWARDWAPLMTIPNHEYAGQAIDVRMLDARYLSERPIDDSVPMQIQLSLLEQANAIPGWHFRLQELPVYMEGGNIMCSRENCFLTEEVLIQNSAEVVGTKALKAPQIIAALERYLDQKVWLVPRMPHESTGHLDMWAKLLNPDTLVIAELSPQTLDFAPEELIQDYQEVRAFLEQQASGLTPEGKVVENALGPLMKRLNPKLKIVRMPMPAPVLYGESEVFRSYTNSLLVNGKAIVPRYQRMGGVGYYYPDRSLMQDYENRVETIYRQAGYQVFWLNADYLIQDGGAWHCATMQVPQAPPVASP